MDHSKWAIIALAFFIVDVNCIHWYLEPNDQKCLKEELQGDVLLTGEYEISEAPGQRIDYTVILEISATNSRISKLLRLCSITFNMARANRKVPKSFLFPFSFHSRSRTPKDTSSHKKTIFLPENLSNFRLLRKLTTPSKFASSPEFPPVSIAFFSLSSLAPFPSNFYVFLVIFECNIPNFGLLSILGVK